jgi:hypothetical protein
LHALKAGFVKRLGFPNRGGSPDNMPLLGLSGDPIVKAEFRILKDFRVQNLLNDKPP